MSSSLNVKIYRANFASCTMWKCFESYFSPLNPLNYGCKIKVWFQIVSLPSNEQLNDANNKSASETLETERGSYKANSNNDNTSNIKSVDDEVLPEYEYISESGID